MPLKKAPPDPVNSLRYGGLSEKHRRLVDSHMNDAGTVLGNYRRMRVLSAPPSGADSVLELNQVLQRQLDSNEEEREFAISVDDDDTHYALWIAEVERLTGTVHRPSEVLRIVDRSEGFLMALKGEFDRARPYQVAAVLHKPLRMLVHDPKTPAYPSGHAFESYLLALHFSDIHPKRMFEFFALADMIADSRIVAGVHYPSDIVAGRSAAVIAHSILKDMD